MKGTGLARSLERKLSAVISGASVEGLGLSVRYSTVRGAARELSDYFQLGPRGELPAVHGVGRFLRLLRAGRISAPEDPYALDDDLEQAALLVNRCRGAAVSLLVRTRFERSLTVWTEAGVDEFRRVIDFYEDDDGLAIRRLGGHSILHVPKQTLIRYAPSSHEYDEVISVE